MTRPVPSWVLPEWAAHELAALAKLDGARTVLDAILRGEFPLSSELLGSLARLVEAAERLVRIAEEAGPRS